MTQEDLGDLCAPCEFEDVPALASSELEDAFKSHQVHLSTLDSSLSAAAD